MATPSGDGVTAFTNWLKKYKELITVLVFFCAGGVWLLTWFATKKQLLELKCIALKNIDLVNSDMRARFALGSILESSRRIDQLSQRQNKLTDAEREELVRVKNQLDLQKKELEDANTVGKSATRTLHENACAEGVKE